MMRVVAKYLIFFPGLIFLGCRNCSDEVTAEITSPDATLSATSFVRDNAAGVTDGYTTFELPYVNYTATDVTGATAISVQIFELGNSLNYITTGKPVGHLNSPADDPGAKFAQCVINVLKALK